MKLWIIDRHLKEDRHGEVYAHVVRAETAEEARKLASECTDGYEGADAWFADTVICKEIHAAGEPGIILTDYNQG